jgi:MFS family permease
MHGDEPLPASPLNPSEEAGLLRRIGGGLAVDVGLLGRNREYRLLCIGQAVALLGSEIAAVAIPYAIYTLTHSSFAVGLMGLFAVVPILTLSFVGGALADAHDRRVMVLLTQGATVALAAILVVNALLPHPLLWLLYAVDMAMVGVVALQRPSIDAMMPRLVARDELTAAIALTELYGSFGMIGGPAIGGVLIAVIGLPATFGVALVGFALSLLALAAMRAVPPPASAERPSLRRMAEGVRYAWSRPDLLGTYAVDTMAMFFGMPTALFPAIASRYGGASVLGLLYGAPAVGAFLAAMTSGWSRRVNRHGLAIILAATGWGLAVIAFGFAPTLPLALVALGLAGAADGLSGLFRGTMWNSTIPDDLRGRLAGIELISYSLGPTLGNLEAGAVATAFSLEVSIVSGGVLCVLGVGALALALPRFRRYDSRLAVHAMSSD